MCIYNKDKKKKKKKITSALHAEGREFEPRQNLVYLFFCATEIM